MWVITSPESVVPTRIELHQWVDAVNLATHMAGTRRTLSHGPHPRYRIRKETP